MVERIEARMPTPREVGAETHVAGRQLRPGMEREMALDFLRQLVASAGRHVPTGTGSGGARSGAQTAAAVGITCLRDDRARVTG